MRNHFNNTTDVIEKFNISVENLNKNYCRNDYDDRKDLEVVENIDFEMAKALISDDENNAVKVAKMILAHKDINDVKVKFE